MVDRERSSRRGISAIGEFLQARYFSADTRFLGIFRIGFGSLMTLDCLRRWVMAREYYSNDGFLPNHFALFRPMGDGVFSLLHAFSSLGEVRVVMGLMLVAFVSYTIGYRTRICQVLAFLFITSLDSRNMFVENGGNVLVNLMAGLTMFLPLGRRFSVDALLASLRARHETSVEALNDRQSPATPAEGFVSLAVLALMLQLATIYFFNFVHKDGVGWKNGSVLHWFLYQDRIVTSLGVFLRDHTPFEVLRVFGYLTLGMEGFLPAILLCPFFRTWMHRIGLVCGVTLHGGIALTSRLGPFSYAMMLFFVLFLGQRDFLLLGRWFGREARKKVVVFDVDCGVCLLTARILKRSDPFGRLSFLGNDRPELFPPGVDAETAAKTVVVVDAAGRVHREERAVFEIMSALPCGILLAWWLRVPGLRELGRALYRLVARRRIEISVWLGLGACGVAPKGGAVTARPAEPPPESFRASLAGATSLTRESLVAVVVVMLSVQVANDNNWMQRRMRVHRPEWITATVNSFRLLEGWGMFAPEPPYDDGHLVVDGRTKNGRKLDPFTGKEPDFDPHSETGWGHQQFWCDYNNRVRFDWHVPNRQHLRDYLRRRHEFEDRPEDELVAFDVWWVQDKSPQPGKKRGEPLPPQKLVSFGFVRDSGARPWQKPKATPSAGGPP